MSTQHDSSNPIPNTLNEQSPAPVVDEWNDVPVQTIPKGTVLYYKGPIGFKLIEHVAARGCLSLAEHDEMQADFTRRRQAMEARFLADGKASREDAVLQTRPV